MVKQSNRIKVLKLLSHKEFVSGQKIAASLSISRTAVNKHITTLKHYGIDIYQVRGKGYKLAKPVELLSTDAIAQALIPISGLNASNTFYFPVIGSTNDFLCDNKLFNKFPLALCVADYQEQGRGRLGRRWQSSMGANLTFSMSVSFKLPIQRVSTLSLRVGVAIAEAISQLVSVDIELKWPNDLYYRGRKLGGILIQLVGGAKGQTSAIIGIGINIGSQPANITTEYGVTSLNEIANLQVSRVDLLANIIAMLQKQFQQLSDAQEQDFIAQWSKYDMLANNPLEFIQQQSKESGVGMGIDANGGYKVKMADNEIVTLYGGEISIRKK